MQVPDHVPAQLVRRLADLRPQPPAVPAVTCGGPWHNKAALSTSDRPPSAQCNTWCAFAQLPGAVHPGKVQVRSRRHNLLRCARVNRRTTRPRSRSSPAEPARQSTPHHTPPDAAPPARAAPRSRSTPAPHRPRSSPAGRTATVTCSAAAELRGTPNPARPHPGRTSGGTPPPKPPPAAAPPGADPAPRLLVRHRRTQRPDRRLQHRRLLRRHHQLVLRDIPRRHPRLRQPRHRSQPLLQVIQLPPAARTSPASPGAACASDPHPTPCPAPATPWSPSAPRPVRGSNRATSPNALNANDVTPHRPAPQPTPNPTARPGSAAASGAKLPADRATPATSVASLARPDPHRPAATTAHTPAPTRARSSPTPRPHPAGPPPPPPAPAPHPPAQSSRPPPPSARPASHPTPHPTPHPTRPTPPEQPPSRSDAPTVPTPCCHASILTEHMFDLQAIHSPSSPSAERPADRWERQALSSASSTPRTPGPSPGSNGV